MRILITGSGGFVGGSFGRYAARAGHSVVGLSRGGQPDVNWPGEHVVTDVAQADLAEIIRLQQPDIVFHGAGSASVAASISTPLDDFRAAVQSWANLLDSIRRSGTSPAVVFPSSAAVYGNPQSLPVPESAPLKPISPYGFHKLACEVLAREYAECFGLSVYVARIFSLFGPSQRRLLLWELYRQATDDSAEITVGGSGLETRDYLHVDEFASAIFAIVKSGQPGIINVARGRDYSVVAMAAMIQAQLGCAKPVRCLNIPRPGEPTHWRADIAELTSRVPANHVFRPLEGCIADCVAAWRSQPRIVPNINESDRDSRPRK